MKHLFTALVAALFIAAAPTPKEVKAVPPAVVRIHYTDGKQGGVCSAFYINLIQLITAQHCLPENGETLMLDDETPLRVVKQSDSLALIERSSPSGVQPLKLATSVEMGENLYVFGYAEGAVFVGFQRHVAGRYLGDLVIDGPVSHGMSGGAMVNERGEVVAVTQGTTESSAVGCLAPEIKALLNGK